VSKLYFSVLVCLIISAGEFILEVFQMLSSQRDANWKVEWARETSQFQIFTLLMGIIIFILKPNDTSERLSQMHEITDDYPEDTQTGDIPGGQIQLEQININSARTDSALKVDYVEEEND
jgi:hypothetical protein